MLLVSFVLIATGCLDEAVPSDEVVPSVVRDSSGSVGLVPAPFSSVNFQSYSTTSALVSDCVTWFCVEDSDTGRIVLDSSVAPPIAGLTKSMRYDYIHGGDGCNSITIGRAIRFTPRQEVWAEFYVRWSPNFTTANASCAPNDHKLIFGDTQAALNGRWAFYVGADSPPNHTLQVERPTAAGGSGGYQINKGGGMSAEDLWESGTWHQIRLYFRNSTTTSSGDGAMQVWIDGVLKHDEAGFNVASQAGGPDKIEGFSFAHNKDDGPAGVAMSLWWGRIQVYDQRPGW